MSTRPTALVTGATGDIGRETSRVLLDQGWDVVGADVTEPTADAPPDDAGWTFRELDVTDAAGVAALVKDLPRLDAVVGIAGIVIPEPFLTVGDDAAARQIQINLTANITLGREAANRFVRQGGGGAMVFTGSWVGDRAWPELVAYSASKAGLAMAARTMALELAPHDIRVNVVSPGIVDAGMARAEAERNPEYAARAAAAVPLGRLQTTADVAAVVAFLLSPAARNITGSTYLVDGGCSLGSP